MLMDTRTAIACQAQRARPPLPHRINRPVPIGVLVAGVVARLEARHQAALNKSDCAPTATAGGGIS